MFPQPSNFTRVQPISAPNEALYDRYLDPGMFSQAMYGQQQTELLEAAFGRLLNLELNGSQVNAQRMGEFATQVAASISDHFEELAAALPFFEKQNVERIAKDNGTEPRAATVEYLSNAYMFRAIRDYFGLPPQDIFTQMDAGGFLAFTWNGSIVASPPEIDPTRRTFHYTRMPSRKNSIETSSRNGELRRDILIGHRLRTSAFKTSAVLRLLYIPEDQAPLFEAIRESAIASSLSVSRFITRGH